VSSGTGSLDDRLISVVDHLRSIWHVSGMAGHWRLRHRRGFSRRDFVGTANGSYMRSGANRREGRDSGDQTRTAPFLESCRGTWQKGPLQLAASSYGDTKCARPVSKTWASLSGSPKA